MPGHVDSRRFDTPDEPFAVRIFRDFPLIFFHILNPCNPPNIEGVGSGWKLGELWSSLTFIFKNKQ